MFTNERALATGIFMYLKLIINIKKGLTERLLKSHLIERFDKLINMIFKKRTILMEFIIFKGIF